MHRRLRRRRRDRIPVKHGGLAAQQADAIAEAIAAQVGAVGLPEPFRPVLRGLLLTGDEPLYLRAELGPGGEREHRHLPAPGTWSHGALWWPPGKVAGRYLTSFLATATATGRPLEDRSAGPAPKGSTCSSRPPNRRPPPATTRPRRTLLDDAEAWLGPLPEHASDRRDSWRRLVRR